MSKNPRSGTTNSELEQRHVDVGARGGYCYVHPRQRREAIQAFPTPPQVNDFTEDATTTSFARPSLAQERDVPSEPARPFKKEVYRDPELCSCRNMHLALQAKIITVIVAGPVTLPPALITEEALLQGHFDQDMIEKTYDGKFWAFRYCPYEDGVLIDDQVPIPARVDDGIVCCATMQLALDHCRVELPSPERSSTASMKFVSPGKAGSCFTTCPWCATTAIDLCFERFRHFLTSPRKR